jgi:hypothetical protein
MTSNVEAVAFVSRASAEAEATKEDRAAKKAKAPAKDADALYDLINLDGQKQYDARDLLASIIDADSLDEYKAIMAKRWLPLTPGSADIRSAIVASQRHQVRTKKAGIQMGGVIYSDSADKSRHACHGLQPNRIADHLFPGRDRLHGRARGGAERHHSERRKTCKCGQQFRRAEDHGRGRRFVRRRETMRSAAKPTILGSSWRGRPLVMP